MHRIGWSLAALALLAACRAHRIHTIPETSPAPFEWPHGWQTDLRLGTAEVLPGPLPSQDGWLDVRVETPMVVEPERAVQPDVSRDGKLLVYARQVDDGTWQLFKQELTEEGANPAPTRLSYTGANHLFPRISPDGAWLAFASDRNGQWDIFVTHLDSPTAVQQISDSVNHEICPSWSPDGSKIAYCYKTLHGHWQIAWANRRTRVHTHLGAGIYPDWHPEGEWLVYQTQPGHPTDFPVVAVVKTDGTGLRHVAEGPRWGCVMPRWSSDGKWIVYSTIRQNRDQLLAGGREEADDVWAIRPDGTDRVRLCDDPFPQYWPAMHGRRLYFVSWHEGNQVIASAQIRHLDWSDDENTAGH